MNARQAALDQSVTVVGMSGLVDRLVDDDTALGLSACDEPLACKTGGGRPLE